MEKSEEVELGNGCVMCGNLYMFDCCLPGNFQGRLSYLCAMCIGFSCKYSPVCKEMEVNQKTMVQKARKIYFYLSRPGAKNVWYPVNQISSGTSMKTSQVKRILGNKQILNDLNIQIKTKGNSILARVPSKEEQEKLQLPMTNEEFYDLVGAKHLEDIKKKAPLPREQPSNLSIPSDDLIKMIRDNVPQDRKAAAQKKPEKDKTPEAFNPAPLKRKLTIKKKALDPKSYQSEGVASMKRSDVLRSFVKDNPGISREELINSMAEELDWKKSSASALISKCLKGKNALVQFKGEGSTILFDPNYTPMPESYDDWFYGKDEEEEGLDPEIKKELEEAEREREQELDAQSDKADTKESDDAQRGEEDHLRGPKVGETEPKESKKEDPPQQSAQSHPQSSGSLHIPSEARKPIGVEVGRAELIRMLEYHEDRVKRIREAITVQDEIVELEKMLRKAREKQTDILGDVLKVETVQ